jgi:DNA invertase Pin-like site-specific DNA recombinase
MNAYAYLRKSSVKDPARELSYEVQEQAVRRMAAEHGDEPLTLLSDWDKSGRLGADKRPGYRALLDAIEGGQAKVVYSYSLSRLGRSVAELARLIDDCTARGVAVRLYADPVDTSTSSGRLLTNVLGSVAQFEADIASERVLAANAAKVARGQSLSTTPFYGDAEGEDAGAVLDAFREAGSFSGAAKLLNTRGVKPRTSGRGWWPSSVSHVVRRLDPKLPALRPTRGVAAGGSDFVLARLLRCPTCGTRLTGTRDRDGSRIRYSCRLGTSLPHERVSVSEHLILPAIQAEVARLVTPEQAEAVTGGEAERVELERRRDRIIDLFEAGHIDRGDRERRLAAVHEDLERIEARQVVLAVPDVDWTWEPRQLNAVLRALLTQIDLDGATFQPVGYHWTVPEWRSPG